MRTTVLMDNSAKRGLTKFLELFTVIRTLKDFKHEQEA